MKKDNRNPKHIYYVSLLNSREWAGVDGLRVRTLRAHPLCQICYERDGIVRSAVDVHHLNPVEGVGRQYKAGEELPESVKAAMRERCFDPKNVIALCIPCHKQIHRDMHSHWGQQQRHMPKAEATDQHKQLTAWANRISGGKATVTDKPKPGIRRTKYGWLTPEELKQREQEELDKWKERIKGHPEP